MTQPLSTWYKALQDSTAIGFDIETTDINERQAKIYNMGVSIFTPDGKVNSENYFMKGVVNPGNLSKSFLEAHSTIASKQFAQEQVDRGILRQYQEAIDSGDLTTVDKAFNRLSTAISEAKGNKFILGQNMNFENKMFKEMGRGVNEATQNITSDTIQKYNIATGRKEVKKNSSQLFSELSEINDLKYGINSKFGSSVYDKLKEMKSNLTEGKDPSAFKTLLKSYSGQYDEIIDKYKLMISQSGQTGRVPVVDLLDVTRAVYARGALSGDINAAYLDRGASVDFLSRTLLDTPEVHLGAEDNESTKKLFDILTKEYDNYTQDSSYKSPVVQKINRALSDTPEISKSFISNLKNNLSEGATSASEMERKLGKSLTSYAHIEKNNQFRSEVYKKSTELLDNNLDNTDKVLQYLDSVSQTENVKSKKLTSPTSKSSSNLKRNILVGSAAVLGVDMLTSRPERETNYNTYDEIYNNQYYGSQFADWQERNGSHRLTY